MYLGIKILFFLLIAAALGILIGWFWRGHRLQSELHDLDSRWRTKLGEVESERDRFASDVGQANEAKAKYEASALEAKRLAETHEKNLQKLRQEQKAKASSLADKEKLAAKLQADLASRDEQLAKSKGADADAGRLGKELAAATGRASALEADLRKAREANDNCKSEVERLQAQIADLQRSAGGAGSSGDRPMGLMSRGEAGGSSTGSGDAGGSGSQGGSSGAAGGSALGLVGGREVSSSTGGAAAGTGSSGSTPAAGSSGASGGGGQTGRPNPGYTQKAASPSHLAEAGSQGFAGRSSGATGGDAGADAENEGVRPEALSAARDGRADDLKRISGVGPKLEKTLNGLGIYHFSQIAAFTPDNVAWVDRHLRFKGRIERENWIGQAKTLAAGGETEFSKRQ